MSEVQAIADMALFFPAGACVGIAYFTGLWWTVNRVISSGTQDKKRHRAPPSKPGRKHRLRLLTLSFLVRAGGAACIMFWLSRGSGEGLVLFMPGFLLARQVVVSRLNRPALQ